MNRTVINVLGNPEITVQGEPVRGFVSSKATALVYYLAVTQREQQRSALATLLWSEGSDAQALKNLRDVLSNLRRVLGAALVIDRQRVGLRADLVESDYAQFMERIAAKAPVALDEALALYKGDFLSAFNVPTAPLFEEWATVERERVRGLALDALDMLAALAVAEQNYAVGVSYTTRLLALDPLRESAHRSLMQLYAYTGQRAAALAQYERLRHALDAELGIDPDAITEQLYREILDGARTSGPAPRPSAPRPMFVVPTPPDTFVGRNAELVQLDTLLADPATRLVSICGLGGAGKTRLSLEMAHRIAANPRANERFTHGIVFVPLANYDATAALSRDAALAVITTAIGEALDVRFSQSEPAQAQLMQYLSAKTLLLVLDNCEHLPVGALLAPLLQRAPGLVVLATSRTRLNIRGERSLALDGLAFPQRQAASHALEQYDAVQLFRQLAQAANTRLRWTSGDAVAAAEICTLVDGLPLGIELAASLTRLLPCAAIARDLAASRDLLDNGPHDLPERHQSLRTVFQHSLQQLNDGQARALRQLAVCVGGFDQRAAERIAGATLTDLLALADHSLLRQLPARSGGTPRFALREMIRQYAAQLPNSEHGAAQTRHSHYYLELVYARGQELRGPAQEAALADLRQEAENIRCAWQFALTHNDFAHIDQAADGVFFFHEVLSRFAQGADMLAVAAEHIARMADNPATQRLLWRVRARQGWLTHQLGQQTAGQQLLAEAVAALPAAAETYELVLPLCYLAAAQYYAGDYVEAERTAHAASALSEATAHRYGYVVATTVLGQIAFLVGNYAEAEHFSAESLRAEHALGNRWGIVFPLMSLGRVALAQQRYDEAQRYFQQGFMIRQLLRDTRGVALCLLYLGDTALVSGSSDAAHWAYIESLALFRDIGSRSGEASALVKLGQHARAIGERARAGSLFQQALAIAWAIQAIPRALEALGGLAATLDDPARAHAIAALIFAHPAATHESRAGVQALLGFPPPPRPLDAQPLAEELATLINALVRPLVL